jgi:hypothetical protein
MEASNTTGMDPDLRGVVEGAPDAITKAQSEEYDPRLIPKEEQAK